MIFHENRLPADDSHEISFQIVSSAAVVIGALRDKKPSILHQMDSRLLSVDFAETATRLGFLKYKLRQANVCLRLV